MLTICLLTNRCRFRLLSLLELLIAQRLHKYQKRKKSYVFTIPTVYRFKVIIKLIKCEMQNTLNMIKTWNVRKYLNSSQQILEK